MLQQRIMVTVEELLSVLFIAPVPNAFWEIMGRVYSGIATLADWTPAFPYAPFAVMSITITTALLIYGWLFAFGMVNRFIKWFGEFRRAVFV